MNIFWKSLLEVLKSKKGMEDPLKLIITLIILLILFIAVVTLWASLSKQSGGLLDRLLSLF